MGLFNKMQYTPQEQIKLLMMGELTLSPGNIDIRNHSLNDKIGSSFLPIFLFCSPEIMSMDRKNVSLTEVSPLCICTLMPIFLGKDGDIRRPWKRNQCFIYIFHILKILDK